MSVGIDKLKNLSLVSLPVGPLDGSTSTSTSSSTSTSTSTSSSSTSTQPKINPFDMANYTAPQPVQLPDGSSIQLPSLSAGEQQQVTSLFSNFTPEQMSKIQAASQNMAQAIKGLIQNRSQASQMNVTQGSSGSDDDDDDDDDGGSISFATPQVAMPSQLTESLPITALPSGSGSNTMSSQTSNAASSSNNPVVLNTQSKLATSIAATTPAASSSGNLQTGGAALSSTSADAPAASVASPQVSQAVTNAATAYSSAQSASGSTAANSYDTTVQGVTYMGVLGLQTDLQNYAQYVQGQLNNQNTVRGELSSVTQALSDWPAGQQTQTFTYTMYDQYGKATTQTQALDQAQAGALQQNLQNQLDSMSSQNQLGQLELQQMSQNYSQGISTISNLLKMNYDTIKSVINNVKSS